jgi:nucleoside-diphosphate-sugar epimerase
VSKIIVFGSSGFVGKAVCNLLEKLSYEIVKIDRNVFSNMKSSPMDFRESINETDILIFASAIAPAKNSQDFLDNIVLVQEFLELTRGLNFAYLLNISSDAVYGDYLRPITEEDTPQPTNIHGMMHHSREFLLRQHFGENMGNLRPTLIYGPKDPHNSYGPNKFIRQALTHNRIEVIGDGEEQRDHIFIEDVARVAHLMVKLRINENLNAATGRTIDFKSIALFIQSQIPKINIAFLDRNGRTMPHDGYRAFNASKLKMLAPDLSVLDLDEGIRATLKEVSEIGV